MSVPASSIEANKSDWMAKLLPFGVLAIFLTLTLFRKMTFFGHPRFWAEEGTLHFAYSFSHSFFQALIQPQVGYLNFWANLSTAIAALGPLEYAPLVTTGMALLVQLIPVALILWNDRLWAGWWRKILGISIFFFVPLTEEVWLNSVNSYTYFAVIAFMILVDVPPVKRLEKWIYRVLLAFCGLSGVSANLLLPLYYYQAWVERTRERVIQSVVLTTFGLVQAAVVFLYRGGAGLSDRFHQLDLSTYAFIVWSQTLSFFALGVENMHSWAKAMVTLSETNWQGYQAQTWWVLPATALILLLLALNLRDNHQRAIYLGSYLVLTVVTMFFSAITNKVDLATTGIHQRIFLAPNVIFGWMLLCAVRFRRGSGLRQAFHNLVSGLAVGLLVTALFWGSTQYWRDWTAGQPWPNWKTEVQTWRETPSYLLNIQPDGWTVKLDK